MRTAMGASLLTAAPASRLEKFLGARMLTAALLAAYWALAFTSTLEKSPAFDEPVHLTGGYSYWITGDWRLHPENGNLPQRIMALPLLPGHWRFPSLDQPGWRQADPYALSHQFLYQVSNDPQQMMALARAAMATVATGLGLMIYLVSRRLFGALGGAVSLMAYAFHPAFLANGPLATSDTTAAFAFLASAWSFWQLLQKITRPRLALSCLAAGLLALSKFSGLLMLPIAAAMVVVRLAVRRPLPVQIIRPSEIRRPLPQAASLLGVCIVHVLAAALIVWASYGSRYEPFQHRQAEDHLFESWERVLADSGSPGSVIAFARDHRLLPEPYLFGLAYMLEHSRSRLAFLNGQLSLSGWHWFFPYAFLAKNPLPLFALLGLAVAAAVVQWRSAPAGASRRPAWLACLGQAFYRTAPLWILMAAYWASAISARLNIGHRHILPVYPPMFILLGAAGGWLKGRRRLPRGLTLALLIAMAGEALWVWPHYLPYFNQFAGGSRNGYKHLVDSSLDWGQDLPGLKRWIQRRSPDGRNPPVYFAYFGSGDPGWYGIPGRQLPSCYDYRPDKMPVELKGGFYCISATLLQAFPYVPGPWTGRYEVTYRQCLPLATTFLKTADDPQARKALLESRGQDYGQEMLMQFDYLRMARLLAYLRHDPAGPIDDIGHSILVFHLSDSQVAQALYGLPAEIEANPFLLP